MKRSEKLIQTILENDIKPFPKGYFTLRTTLLWLAFAMATLLGALAFSIVLFCIQQTDFDLLSHLSHSRLELFLGVLPFFWLAFLFVFLLASMTSFRHSPKGYKLTLGRLLAYCTALSLVAGALVFLAGGGRWLEQAFDVRLSLYESVQEKKIKLWSMPREGYLSGAVGAVDDSVFTLRDFGGQSWSVRYSGAFMPPVVRLEAGEKVKIIGKMRGGRQFEAAEIRPWGGPGTRMREPHR